MAVTEAQARRAVRRAELSWAPEVKDPRAEKGQRYAHHGLLSLLMAAFACGLVCLRRVEGLSEDLGLGARRKLGIPRCVSDTALYQRLARQEAAGLRETVWGQVRALIDGKVIENNLFAHGVLSVDGKCCWKSTSKHVEGAKTSTDPETGVATSSFSAFLGMSRSRRTTCAPARRAAIPSRSSPGCACLPTTCLRPGGPAARRAKAIWSGGYNRFVQDNALKVCSPATPRGRLPGVTRGAMEGCSHRG